MLAVADGERVVFKMTDLAAVCQLCDGLDNCRDTGRAAGELGGCFEVRLADPDDAGVSGMLLWRQRRHRAQPFARRFQPFAHTGSEPARTDVWPTASFWAIVVPQGGGGVCIVDAKVEIVAGQAIGQSGTMPEVCDVWWVNGAFFTGLAVGVEMTVRASAPGYLAQEITVMPTPDPGPLMATVIKLTRIQTP